MYSVLLAALIIVAVVMVLVILLQKSEGGGMSGSQAASMFGGALTGASAGNFLTKLTAWLATLFFILAASLAYLASREGQTTGRSEVRNVLRQADRPIETRSSPAGELPPLPDIPDDAVEVEILEVVEIEEEIPETPDIPED